MRWPRPTSRWPRGGSCTRATPSRATPPCWAREERERPAPHRTAARIYEDMGALSQAVEAAGREVAVAPADASAWERLGRLRLRAFDRAGARGALERARSAGPTEQGLLDLALVANLMGDVGAEVTACEQATQ